MTVYADLWLWGWNSFATLAHNKYEKFQPGGLTTTNRISAAAFAMAVAAGLLDSIAMSERAVAGPV
jgi:hypothetical protein